MNTQHQEIGDLVARSIPPSEYVRLTKAYRGWGNITECPECGLRGHICDASPYNPCRECGSSVTETVGKWVEVPRPWWRWWGRKGYWKKLRETP